MLASGVLESGAFAEFAMKAEVRCNLSHLVMLVGKDEAGGDARGARAAGAAGAVHVGVAVLGGVEVDHVGDLIDVDPARGDVGRDEGVDLAELEVGEGATALALGLVPVHCHRPDLLVAELLDEPVRSALGADEDQGAASLGVAKLRDQRIDLVRVRQMDEAVLGRRLLHVRRVHVPARVMCIGRGQLPGRSLERRREEERLAIARHSLDDPVDGGLEAHVEHPVGLVEDEELDLLEVEGAAIQQVLEATGGRHDDVGLRRLLCLRRDSDPAEDGGDLQSS